MEQNETIDARIARLEKAVVTLAAITSRLKDIGDAQQAAIEALAAIAPQQPAQTAPLTRPN